MLLTLPFGLPEPSELIDTVTDDVVVASSLTQSVRDGEVDGYNDLGPYRRCSHRGSRAEAQTLQHLGRSLEPLGGQWEEVTNQARFLFATRYPQPLRLVHTRGGLRPDGLTFRISIKGDRTLELINENQKQLALFERTATTPVTRRCPIEEAVYNLWVIADSTKAGRLAIYLAYPINLVRDWSNPTERWHMNLICSQVRLLWEGSLLDSDAPLADRPEATPLEEPFLEERDFDATEDEAAF